MSEITYSSTSKTRFSDSFGNEIFPKVKLKIKVLELSFRRVDMLEGCYSMYFSLKERKFLSNVDNEDILVIEYPISYERRSGSTVRSSSVKITIERLWLSEEIRVSNLEDFWRLINKFEVIE